MHFGVARVVEGRYFGRDYPGPRTDRVTVRIEPERVTGGDNRQPWDAD